MEELAKKYDIIVLDEYHRCGAKEWGTKVKELLKISSLYLLNGIIDQSDLPKLA